MTTKEKTENGFPAGNWQENRQGYNIK